VEELTLPFTLLLGAAAGTVVFFVLTFLSALVDLVSLARTRLMESRNRPDAGELDKKHEGVRNGK